ncbi:MAG: Mrp/NBP35 family ATP-binding protein [Bryobacterales bacterium]|nr:Mrp/NBP35 family ATP-binding protein [Bryobacterales bacterium]MDE0628979.1 Mrp/NBP35 family ATP-binding protein [Bryobacterales bacterium]
MADLERIQAALRFVIHPAYGRSIVDLGLVQDLAADEGLVRFKLQNTVPRSGRAESVLRAAVEAAQAAAPDARVEADLTASARANPAGASGKGSIEGVSNIIPVASGKGGVGKSTVSANLALALAATGAKVGLMDADVYGPSIPHIMGAREGPRHGGRGIIPVETHGIPIISTGFFVRKDQAVVWRGPMLAKMVEQLTNQVEWGLLDYLVIDLPPGTGDVQLSLCQRLALTGAVVVTTPQPMAVNVAEKAIIMFQQLKTPILGVVENMSYFESRATGEREYIFGSGGADRIAQQWSIPVLGRVPLATTVRETSDEGTPIVLAEPDAPASRAFLEVGKQLAAEVAMHNLKAEGESMVKITF